MGILETLLIGIALSMDAFAVSIASGVSAPKMPLKNAVVIAAFFGGFQFFMPVLGWSAGEFAYDFISAYDHWVAFALLAAIGGKMVFDSLKGESAEDGGKASFADPLKYGVLFMLAVATSIDALAVGISFSMLKVHAVKPAVLIGITTFLFSLAGTKFGCFLGDKFAGKIGILGGIVLVCIGFKILIAG